VVEQLRAAERRPTVEELYNDPASKLYTDPSGFTAGPTFEASLAAAAPLPSADVPLPTIPAESCIVQKRASGASNGQQSTPAAVARTDLDADFENDHATTAVAADATDAQLQADLRADMDMYMLPTRRATDLDAPTPEAVPPLEEGDHEVEVEGEYVAIRNSAPDAQALAAVAEEVGSLADRRRASHGTDPVTPLSLDAPSEPSAPPPPLQDSYYETLTTAAGGGVLGHGGGHRAAGHRDSSVELELPPIPPKAAPRSAADRRSTLWSREEADRLGLLGAGGDVGTDDVDDSPGPLPPVPPKRPSGEGPAGRGAAVTVAGDPVAGLPYTIAFDHSYSNPVPPPRLSKGSPGGASAEPWEGSDYSDAMSPQTKSVPARWRTNPRGVSFGSPPKTPDSPERHASNSSRISLV